MAGNEKVILDAGHGGDEPGAIYNGRKEKDDTLRLTLAVGRILEENGVSTLYTRTTDVYNSPQEKAEIANRSGADLFISIHRNAMPVPGTGRGASVLVYEDSGIAAVLAENILKNLVQLGFKDQGIVERPGLVVLRKTQMPAVLVEVGFIDSPVDNAFFDRNFDAIAKGHSGWDIEYFTGTEWSSATFIIRFRQVHLKIGQKPWGWRKNCSLPVSLFLLCMMKVYIRFVWEHFQRWKMGSAWNKM